METAKVSTAPGSKEEQKKAPARLPLPDTAARRTAQARMDVDLGLDGTQSARRSTKDDTWDGEASMEVATDDDGVDEPLGQAGARLYRGVAARLNYTLPQTDRTLHMWSRRRRDI